MTRRTVEELELVLWKLRQESDQMTFILVEGKRDVAALRSLGMTGSILPLRDLYKILPRRDVRVIIMLDFDREGRQMAKRIVRLLSQLRIKADTFYYRRLAAARKLGVNTVEALGSFLKDQLSSE